MVDNDVEQPYQNITPSTTSSSQQNVFTDEHYNSNDGMVTMVWGPCLWHALHTISFNYPVNPTPVEKIRYFKFFTSLKDILPCGACRTNCIHNLDKLNFSIDCFKNRSTLSRFVYDLHELVNTHLGKTSNLSYDEVRDRFESFRARCLVDGGDGGGGDGGDGVTKLDTKGCTDPLVGIKSKCVLAIVPRERNCNTFNVSKLCKIRSNKN